MKQNHIKSAISVIIALGLPKEQQNERTAVCLLALLNLTPEKDWKDAENPLIGITPIMEWVNQHYGRKYAPNTRETFRRQSMHQFCDAGIALYNPDEPKRPVNSPKTVYRIEPAILALLRSFGTKAWAKNLGQYLEQKETLIAQYAKERQQNRVPVILNNNQEIFISPGEHSNLIKAVIEEFAPRFVPGSDVVYIGDTGAKWAYCNEILLENLGIKLGSHGKMPDVVLRYSHKNWLLLIESVTSHGPVDGKRYSELSKLFAESILPLVYVTAFPNRILMSRYLSALAWETEVWIADAPSHLIHLNGTKFLGPYS